MTIRRMSFACLIAKATDTHALIIYNISCLSTETVVTRTRVIFIRTLLVLFPFLTAVRLAVWTFQCLVQSLQKGSTYF